jgi:hypothetical protein
LRVRSNGAQYIEYQGFFIGIARHNGSHANLLISPQKVFYPALASMSASATIPNVNFGFTGGVLPFRRPVTGASASWPNSHHPCRQAFKPVR